MKESIFRNTKQVQKKKNLLEFYSHNFLSTCCELLCGVGGGDVGGGVGKAEPHTHTHTHTQKKRQLLWILIPKNRNATPQISFSFTSRFKMLDISFLSLTGVLFDFHYPAIISGRLLSPERERRLAQFCFRQKKKTDGIKRQNPTGIWIKKI